MVARAAFIASPICDEHDGVLIPALQDSYHECPQLGPLTLASITKDAGHSCDLIDWVTADDFSTQNLARQLSAYEILFFSVNSMNWAAVLCAIRQCKSINPLIIVCVGGPHPTLYPEFTAGFHEIDAIYIGEADSEIVSVIEYLDSKSPRSTPSGLRDLRQSRWIGDGGGPRQENLRSLKRVLPRYELYDISKYCVLPIETSRGCKFRCEFCSIPTKSYWREHTSERAIEMLHYALPYASLSKAGIISIVDDTFTTDELRVVEIAKGLDSRFSRRINFDATVVDIRREVVVDAMQEFASGFLVGAEVASKPDAKIIKKAATPSLITDAARALLKYNLADRSVFSFIIGFPWHTFEDCMNTLNFASHLIMDYGVTVYFQWYWPIPGSEIWRSLEKDGKVSMDIVSRPAFFREPKWFFGTRSLSVDEIKLIDDKVLLLQSIINVGGQPGKRNKMNYTSPFLYAGTLVHRRDPLTAEYA